VQLESELPNEGEAEAEHVHSRNHHLGTVGEREVGVVKSSGVFGKLSEKLPRVWPWGDQTM
jgi:hypothetical protein